MTTTPISVADVLAGATHLGHRRWSPPPHLEAEVRELRAHGLQANLLRYRVDRAQELAWPAEPDELEVRRLLRLAERHEAEREWRLKVVARAMELAVPAAMLVWCGPGDPPAREGIDWMPVGRVGS